MIVLYGQPPRDPRMPYPFMPAPLPEPPDKPLSPQELIDYLKSVEQAKEQNKLAAHLIRWSPTLEQMEIFYRALEVWVNEKGKAHRNTATFRSLAIDLEVHLAIFGKKIRRMKVPVTKGFRVKWTGRTINSWGHGRPYCREYGTLEEAKKQMELLETAGNEYETRLYRVVVRKEMQK